MNLAVGDWFLVSREGGFRGLDWRGCDESGAAEQTQQREEDG